MTYEIVKHPVREIVLGSSRIPVQIFEGPGRRRRQIRYWPEKLWLDIPYGDGVDGAFDFLRAREARVLEGWREVRERHGRIADSGDGWVCLPWKILFRGTRRVICWKEGGFPSVRYTKHFDVWRRPGESEDQARATLIRYLQTRLLDEVRVLVSKHAARLDVRTSSVEVGDLDSRWGAVRADGTLAFHWRLAHAPKGSIEYAVLHLLGHLRHPFHCDGFDAFLRQAGKGFKLDHWWLDEFAWLLDPTDGDRI
ncbi:MAG: YgjP-like metallopeptidase domain-containing protein [Pseudomonadota bacterium]